MPQPTTAIPLPARLRHFREQYALTQAALAKKLGVSKITVLRWENGTAKPSQLAAERLAEIGFDGLGAEDTNLSEVPRRSRASQPTLWPEDDGLSLHELRQAVRSKIRLDWKSAAFEPAPYVYNGPESQLPFFEELFVLQEGGARALTREQLAERLSLVASVDGYCVKTSQAALERPKQNGAHWNTNYGPHGWHRYVGRFPPHLVRALLNHFGAGPSTTVLDPFAGSGTSLTECRLLGVPCIGIELCPLSVLISTTKSQFPSDGEMLRRLACRFEQFYRDADDRISDATRRSHNRLLERRGNLVPKFPNHEKWLTAEAFLGSSLTLQFAKTQRGFARTAMLVALSSKMRSIGNVDVDVARAEYRKTPRENVDVLRLVHGVLERMAIDIDLAASSHRSTIGDPDSVEVLHASCLDADLDPSSVNFIVTSPPYGVEASSYLRAHLLSYRCLEHFLGVDPYAFGDRAVGSEYVGDEASIGPNQNAGAQSPTFRRFFDEILSDSLPRKHVVRAYMMMHFFDDMLRLGQRFEQWVRRRGRVAFVIGNKRIGHHTIPADQIIAELFRASGFKHDRSIAHKLKCNNSNSQVPWQERIIQDEFIQLFTRR